MGPPRWSGATRREATVADGGGGAQEKDPSLELSAGTRRRFARRMTTGGSDELTAILALANATDIISFAGGFPDPGTFPGPQLAEIMSRLVSEGDTSALQYAPVAGLPGPRDFL